VLGGGSSVNYMMYVRGHKQDFDSWEKHGATGWDWENVKKYFKRAENIDSEGGEIMLKFTYIRKAILSVWDV